MRYLLVLSLFFAISGNAVAQIKYGHIDSDEILESMPEYRQLTSALQRKQNEQEAKIRAMYTDFQKRQAELQQLGPALMVAVIEEKEKELMLLQQEIEAYQQNAAPEMERLRDKLLLPLQSKYRKVVDIVAKENGYTLILDQASGIIAYGNEGNDITALVKKKMGIN